MKIRISLCSFQSKKFFDDIKLNITPKPDTEIRIFLAIKKLDATIEIKEQKLEPNQRKVLLEVIYGG